MSAIFTKNFGIQNALNFEKTITFPFANTYLSIGRNTQWSASDVAPAPTDTSNTFYDLWNNMIGMVKITAADINLVIPRVDWVTGTNYTAYNQDLQLFSKADANNITYDLKFYVRNNQDQVFKCLSNNSSVVSTVMPEISIDGQLPENAYIETSDGYKWKYMYTIPAGLKEKFFTSQFMPIVSETIVTNSAVDGRIDIINITANGAGYNANSNSNSLSILSVSGDGSNANITVKVTTTAANGGNITGVNIINAGNNYTRATITLTDANKIVNTANATLIAVIGPPGGHGSNNAQELGASNLMICAEVEDDENGELPIAGTGSTYRQIGLLKDIQFANSAFATGSVYRATNKYTLTQPNKNFDRNETVYVGSTLASATFTGVVEAYDGAPNYYLYLNNTNGSLTVPATIIGANSGAIATVLEVTESEIKKFSGDLLYIENTANVTRSATETQQIKITLRF